MQFKIYVASAPVRYFMTGLLKAGKESVIVKDTLPS